MSVSISGTSGPSVGPLTMTLNHGPSGAQITTVPPVDNGGNGSSFSPTDLCAAALGACASTIMMLFAKRNEVPLERVDFDLEKEMSVNPRRIGRLTVRYRLETDCTDQQFEAMERAGRACPVRLTLGPDVEVVEVYERA